jgi:hypothetical protein
MRINARCWGRRRRDCCGWPYKRNILHQRTTSANTEADPTGILQGLFRYFADVRESSWRGYDSLRLMVSCIARKPAGLKSPRRAGEAFKASSFFFFGFLVSRFL